MNLGADILCLVVLGSISEVLTWLALVLDLRVFRHHFNGRLENFCSDFCVMVWAPAESIRR